MLTRGFNNMNELNEFVNEKSIRKEDIVNIFQDSKDTFILIYYERN